MWIWQWPRKRSDVDEEIESHLRMAARDRITGAEPPEAADRARGASSAIVTLVSEDTRRVWTWNWLEQLFRDIRYAVRSITRNPGFAAVAVLALALGIGANTAVFSVVNGVLLRPLPFPDPARLVWIQDGVSQSDRAGWPACVQDFLHWQSRAQSFEQLAAYTTTRFNLTGDGEAEQLSAASVTVPFFSIVGVRPILGRSFIAGEDQPGNPPRPFSANACGTGATRATRKSSGKSIELNGRTYTVVGVLPGSFQFRSRDIDVWVTFTLTPPTRRGPFFLSGVARLKPGVSLSQVNAEMDVLGREMESRDPTGVAKSRYPTTPLLEKMTGEIRPLLLVLTGAVFLVLLIAVFNVANLLLARATARQHEMAIRLSIGAGKGQLIRQLLTESTVLALAGGALGVLLAYGGVAALRQAAPAGLPRLHEIALDARVLLFTFLVSAASGVAFGLAPAFGSARSQPGARLKEGGRGTESRGYRRLRGVLVVTEVALSMILLAGAGLLIRSFNLLGRVQPGFQAPPDRLLMMQLSPTGARYGGRDQILGYWTQVLDRVHAVPGVESAAVSLTVPPDRVAFTDGFEIQGRTPREGGPLVAVPFVSSRYFETLGIPLLRGRAFDSRDTFNSPGVVIVSESLARRYFGNEDPVGQRLKHGGPELKNPYKEIVGVAADVKYEGLANASAPVYYESASQFAARPMWLLVRTHAGAAGMLPAVSAAIRALDSNVPIASAGTMEQALYETVALPRFRSTLMGIFAVAALLLAAVGIYGVLAYSVQQRTQEIGIRMALGANSGSVIRLMIGQGSRLALAGTAIGIGGGLALVRVLEKMLFGVKPADGITFAAVTALLLCVALAASYIPARRAARIDPVRALRQD
jgi:putative ABC transport system permease protein